jgi:hypothetical protein
MHIAILVIVALIAAVEALRLWVSTQGRLSFQRMIDGLVSEIPGAEKEEWVVKAHSVGIDLDGGKVLVVEFQDRESFDRGRKK